MLNYQQRSVEGNIVSRRTEDMFSLHLVGNKEISEQGKRKCLMA